MNSGGGIVANVSPPTMTNVKKNSAAPSGSSKDGSGTGRSALSLSASARGSIEVSWTPMTTALCEHICACLQELEDEDTGRAVRTAQDAARQSQIARMEAPPEVPIHSIALFDNQMTAEHCVQLAAALEHASAFIKNLAIGFNKIGKTGSDSLASFVNISSKLHSLDLRGNLLSASCARRLIGAVALNTSIRHLGLASNKLGPEGMELLFKAFEKNTCLLYLDVSQNEIGPSGAVHLAKILQLPTCSLEELNVYGNRLGPNGASQIAMAAAKNRQLRALRMGNNNAGDKSANAIAALLCNNNTLRTLDIRLNTITEVGASVLSAEGIQLNGRLASLTLSGNPIGAVGMDALANALIHNQRCQVRDLDLSFCSLGAVGGMRVANVIATTASLETIDLSGNDIDDESVISIAGSLLESGSLWSINLSSNSFGENGVAHLMEVAQMNAHITSLVLCGSRTFQAAQRKLDNLLVQRRVRRVAS